MGSRLGFHIFEIAFPEVERDFIERALLPLFCLSQPENLALGIQHGAFSANKFLAANFSELFHELPRGVKPICFHSLTEFERESLTLLCGE